MTERVDTDFDMDLTSLMNASDDEVDEMYAGAPESFKDAGPESAEVNTETPAAVPYVEEPGMALLVNLKFPFESIFLNHEAIHEGKVQFEDGWLSVREDAVDAVLAAAPYVYLEPKDGPVFGPHPETGFATRNSNAYSEFLRNYYANL